MRRRLPAAASVEDLLQSAYVRFETYRKTNAVNNPEAFLIRTAVNLSIDERRSRKWVDDRPVEDLCQTFAHSDPLQDEVLAAQERLRLVDEALGELPQRTRTILLLHRVEGKKYREIAELMGISQSAVEKHIARAALFLATRMEGL